MFSEREEELTDFVSTAKGVLQSLVEKHFPAPDRDKINRILGIGKPKSILDELGLKLPDKNGSSSKGASGASSTSSSFNDLNGGKRKRKAAEKMTKRMKTDWDALGSSSEEEKTTALTLKSTALIMKTKITIRTKTFTAKISIATMRMTLILSEVGPTTMMILGLVASQRKRTKRMPKNPTRNPPRMVMARKSLFLNCMEERPILVCHQPADSLPNPNLNPNLLHHLSKTLIELAK